MFLCKNNWNYRVIYINIFVTFFFREIKKFNIEKMRIGKIFANENNMLRSIEYKSC